MEEIMESILLSVKKMLGVSEEYTFFDPDIIMSINSVLSVLTQVGVGPSDGFQIEDESATWNDFLSDAKKLNSVKSFIHLRVKLLFDPPMSSAVTEVMKQQAEEFLWRLNVEADTKENEVAD